MTLTGFVLLYIAATIAIGVIAATRVKNTSDFALAGRSLPLPMVITATFATWFGSETILGLPGRFIESGCGGLPAPRRQPGNDRERQRQYADGAKLVQRIRLPNR